MAVNVIRIIKIVKKYRFDLFKTGRGPTSIEIAKIKKYFLYFFLSMLAFAAFTFIMAYIKQSMAT
jgi:hypothetical protein